MPQAAYDAQQLNTGCMDGTRKSILSEISSWIKNPDAQQVCWLTGKAGSGKTSIAKTVCMEAKKDTAVVLGGSFFCSRLTGLAAQRDVRCVVPTLAQYLALESAEFRHALAQMFENNTDLQYKEVAVQVAQLLRTPLLALKKSRVPVLFVIDAIDECGGGSFEDDTNSHHVVRSVLEALFNLPPSDSEPVVKFLVTSRPEAHIRDTFIANKDCSLILQLSCLDKEEVDADIQRYLTETLAMKFATKTNFNIIFTKSEIERLVRFCDGLFIVATISVGHTFVKGAEAAEARFTELLNASGDCMNATAAKPLDHMYRRILEDATREDEPGGTELQALLRLLASLLSTRITLSIAALADLLGWKPFHIRASLSLLHSVIYVPEDNEAPGLRTVHASFGDYLLARAPDHIRIPPSHGHDTLAHACLDLMNNLLHFNISQSRSSYKPNPSTRPAGITPALEYACLHWVHHAAYVSNPNDDTEHRAIDREIDRKFRPKFLFWLEVLSVLGKVSLASGLLLIAASDVSCIPEDSVNLLNTL